MSGWTDVSGAVALALAEDRHSTDPDDPFAQSMLAAVTGAPSPRLRQTIDKLRSLGPAADAQFDPLIYANDVPVLLLSRHIVDVAADAVTPDAAASLIDLPGQDAPLRRRVIGIVAVGALSTLRLNAARHAGVLAQVRRRLPDFDEPLWTAALDALARRTAELHDLLATERERRNSWRAVSSDDRVLAEALAAAVVGGAADGSGVPPDRWFFPFHVFCKLALSAAEDALDTIESWLGIEFAPAPRSNDRAASLAVLVAGEASGLHLGCRCKADVDPHTVAYVPRGNCKQADHDLRSWRPGDHKPGGQGGRYATTLWGWQRRWLGGADASRASGDDRSAGRPQLRTNDVAGSVLARRWLHEDRGLLGPTLLYDRILPEFCVNCGRKVELVAAPSPSGLVRVERADCCDKPQRVYRTEFARRQGRQVIKPKLGLIVASANGTGGYRSTESLGPLWLCVPTGRYFIDSDLCPGCGKPPGSGQHQAVHYGWVLLPLADAWTALRLGAAQPQVQDLPSQGTAIGPDELRFLQEAFGEVQPGRGVRLRSPHDAWDIARGWSAKEVNQFSVIAGKRGLELLFLCKQSYQTRPPSDSGRA